MWFLLIQLFVAIVTLCVTSTQAVSSRRPGSSFRAHLNKRSLATPCNGSAARLRAFRKYGWTVPRADGLPNAFERLVGADSRAANSKSGSVTASPEQSHSEYLSSVTIGGQKLNLDFDTGSADFWVFSSYLSAQQNMNHRPFYPKESLTYRNMTGQKWRITYGDGSGATGIVGTDVVNIGDIAVTQAVELATDISDVFVDDVASDGIVGLGFSSLNTVRPIQQKTFFDRIKSRLISPLFTVDLQEDGTGTYQFGSIDKSKYQGNLNIIGIDSSNGFWQMTSSAFEVGGNRSHTIGANPAIADTGTSLLILDDAVVEAYYARVNGSGYSVRFGGYIFPCAAQLPSFGVVIGQSNYVVTIPGSMINYAPISANWCYGGIQSNEGYPLQILGDLLFRNAFVVFYGGTSFTGLGIASKA